MLKKEKQEKYLSKRWKALTEQAGLFCQTLSQDALHDFRVEIKKIRAIINFLQKCSSGKIPQTQADNLKAIFKQAGHIRSAHISRELGGSSSSQGSSPEEGGFKTQAGHLCRQIHETLPDKLPVPEFRDISNQRILRSYHKKIKKLAFIFASSDMEPELHQSRKRIKSLIYLHKLLGKSLKKELNLDLVYLDELQDVIGQWHDAEMTLNQLPAKTAKDRKQIQSLKDKSRELIDSIHSLTRNFTVKAGLSSFVV